VVEIKKDTIRDSALSQIMRYIQGVKDYLHQINAKYAFGVIGFLVGPDIADETASALRLLKNTVSYYELVVSINVELFEKTFARRTDSSSYNPESFSELLENKISPMNLEEGE